MRRLLALFGLTGLILALAAPMAMAADVSVSPSGTVDGSTTLRVEVDRRRGELIENVTLRLLRGGPDGETVGSRQWAPEDASPSCAPFESTECTFSAGFDPRSGAPFAGRSLNNGDYTLQAVVEREGLPPDRASVPARLRVPPRGASGVSVAADGQALAVSWSASPERDLRGYRVEHRPSGGSWQSVTTVSATSHRFDVAPGDHEVRVVALRRDGVGGTIETASSSASASVAAPSSDDDGDEGAGGSGDSGSGDSGSSGSGSGGSGSGGSGNGGSGGSGDGARDGSGPDGSEAGGSNDTDAGDDSDDGDGEPEDADGSPGSTSSLSIDSAELAEREQPSPKAAERPDYSEELDYSRMAEDGDGDGGGDGEERDDSGDVVLSGPGLQNAGGAESDRVVVPVAVGLVMTAVGLHLWRWLKVPAA